MNAKQIFEAIEKVAGRRDIGGGAGEHILIGTPSYNQIKERAIAEEEEMVAITTKGMHELRKALEHISDELKEVLKDASG